jgi:hypothetical protein
MREREAKRQPEKGRKQTDTEKRELKIEIRRNFTIHSKIMLRN